MNLRMADRHCIWMKICLLCRLLMKSPREPVHDGERTKEVLVGVMGRLDLSGQFVPGLAQEGALCWLVASLLLTEGAWPPSFCLARSPGGHGDSSSFWHPR